MGGALESNEITDIFTKYPSLKDSIKIFVETGTYHGETSILASKHFDTVYTFEIFEDNFLKSVKNGAEQGVENIEFFFGDSCALMPDVLKNDKRGAFFFLDAHISGNDSGFNGKELVPVISELQIITDLEIRPMIVVIDDYRLWHPAPTDGRYLKAGEIARDWNHITDDKILQGFGKHTVKDSWIENDRMFIILNIN